MEILIFWEINIFFIHINLIPIVYSNARQIIKFKNKNISYVLYTLSIVQMNKNNEFDN